MCTEGVNHFINVTPFLIRKGHVFYNVANGVGRGSDGLASHARLFPDLVPPLRILITPEKILKNVTFDLDFDKCDL